MPSYLMHLGLGALIAPLSPVHPAANAGVPSVAVVSAELVWSKPKGEAMAVESTTPAWPKISWSKGERSGTYQLTDHDVLVFARAVAREGKPNLAVIWSLIRRYAITRLTRNWTFATFVEAYAQPINPLWFPTGRLHLERIAKLTRQGNTAAIADENARAQNRLRYSVVPWEAIPSTYTNLIRETLSGLHENPVPLASHYQASFADAGATPEQARTAAERRAEEHNRNFPKDLWNVVVIPQGFARGVNWFFAERNYSDLCVTLAGGIPRPKA